MVRLAGNRFNEAKTFQLDAAQLASLVRQVEEARFFDLRGAYLEQDPPGIIVEYDIVTITVTQAGRSKSVTLRGSSETPAPLLALQSMLYEIQSFGK